MNGSSGEETPANQSTLPSLMTPAVPPHAESVESTLASLSVALNRGLDPAEVRRRQEQFGPNAIEARNRRGGLAILRDQLRSVVVGLLTAAAGLSFLFGEWVDGLAIVVVLIINTAIGFFTEFRAMKSMEALRRLGKVRATVRRAGHLMPVVADELVPGDIVVLSAGDIVPADIRLTTAANLRCDQSTLTGESVPVAKSVAPMGIDEPVADRSNIAFRGTAVTAGSGDGVVIAIGSETELGRIAALAETAKPELSGLQQGLDKLGNKLVRLTLFVVAAIALAWLATGRELMLTLETSIALAVAAVPEGLPIVATVVLAKGVWRMARRNALIERLSAVETVGAVTLVLSDKTGTLTENRMRATRVLLAEGDIELAGDYAPSPTDRSAAGVTNPKSSEDAGVLEAMRIGALCNDAEIGTQGAIGDPMETALIEAALKLNLSQTQLREDYPRIGAEPFEAERRAMATIHAHGDVTVLAVKGAPESVLQYCTSYRTAMGSVPMTSQAKRAWLDRAAAAASDGLRVIALANRESTDPTMAVYEGLNLIGLVGLLDPPRAGVAAAIAECKAAGIRVSMLTGDHADTAMRIARDVGINGTDRGDGEVFARITPAAKLDLVRRFQSEGDVVAMTGDGVNDAPALRKADIGIAMGRRGTDVAREAAAMVLLDDSFGTIVAAIAQGRVIFTNIRRVVIYLLSCNLSEILVLGVATLAGFSQPLLPLQILFLNLVTDIFPAFALGMGEGDPNVMRRPPRDPSEPILTNRDWRSIAKHAASITVATLTAFWLALDWLDLSDAAAGTVAFLTLALAQLWHVFNMREQTGRIVSNDVFRNPYVWGALLLCIVLLAGAMKLPLLADVLGLVDLNWQGLVLVGTASLVPVVIAQFGLELRRRRSLRD